MLSSTDPNGVNPLPASGFAPTASIIPSSITSSRSNSTAHNSFNSSSHLNTPNNSNDHHTLLPSNHSPLHKQSFIAPILQKILCTSYNARILIQLVITLILTTLLIQRYILSASNTIS